MRCACSCVGAMPGWKMCGPQRRGSCLGQMGCTVHGPATATNEPWKAGASWSAVPAAVSRACLQLVSQKGRLQPGNSPEQPQVWPRVPRLMAVRLLSQQALEEMIGNAEAFYQALGFPYRCAAQPCCACWGAPGRAAPGPTRTG